MTEERWTIICLGGRSARSRDVRAAVVGMLEAAGLVPSAMAVRDDDVPGAYDAFVALAAELAFPGPLVFSGLNPAFEAMLWIGDLAQIRLDLPASAADTVGDALATTVAPDLMWAWPQWVSGSQQAERFMSDVGPDPGEGTFRGWGARTWMSPLWAQRLLPAQVPPPVRVTRLDGELVRVDLAPDVHDRGAVLAGHAALAGDALPPTPEPHASGRRRLDPADVARRAGPGVALGRIEIHDVDLRYRDLTRSSWGGAVIVDSDLDHATLTDAVFDEAQLDQVSLRDCDAQGASFVASDVVSSFLERARLSGADLRGASIVNCEMTEAIAREANLEAALLEDTRLVGADLTGARLDRATLRRCDLSGARLDGVDLGAAIMEDCVLTGATQGEVSPESSG